MMLNEKPNTYQIQVRQRGQLTLPSKLRELMNIDDGDVLTLVSVGETLVLIPKPLRTPQLTEQLASLMEDAGVTLADMLADLPRIREELSAERYHVQQPD